MRKDYSDILEEFTFPEKDRSRHDRRKNNAKKALRKQKVCKEIYGEEFYDNLHEYSKGKIHCSCPMCSGESKTNRKKVKGNGTRSSEEKGKKMRCPGTTNHRMGKNWSASDIRKRERLDAE